MQGFIMVVFVLVAIGATVAVVVGKRQGAAVECWRKNLRVGPGHPRYRVFLCLRWGLLISGAVAIGAWMAVCVWPLKAPGAPFVLCLFLGSVLALAGFGAVYVGLMFCSPNPDRCLRCGYDLRGNVSGRCPECDQEIR